MGLLTKIKNVFMPSAEVGAQRRLNVFGTTSKVPAIAAGLAAGAAVAVAGAAGAGVLTAQVAKKAAVSVASTAVKAAKAVIPTTTKGKIVAAVATPIVVGAVTSQPLGTAKTIAKAPGELAKFGAGIADLAANPSAETAKNLITESPLLTAGAALLTAGILGKGALLTAAAVKTLGGDSQPVKDYSPAEPNYNII